MGFVGMGFVMKVRCLGEMKITGKILTKFLKAVCGNRFKE